MKNLSLRGRLVKTLLLQMTAAALLSGALALAFIYHEVDEVYDATLVQFSRSLASMPAVDTDPHNYTGLNRAQDSELAHKYERKISYRILRGDKVITTSAEGPDMEDIYLPPGFSDLHRDKKGREEWRIYTLPDEKSGMTIEVAEKYEIRRELTLQLLSSLLIPGLFFIMGAVIAIWWGTSSSLKILKHVSKEVKSRAADDLSPIDDHDIPVEIQALTSALNELFGRIETSFAREREFTDNAAHELRTPLAAIKTQAQTLLRSENLTQAGHDGLENLIAAIDRATEMTETLLSFARLQGDRSESVPVVLSDIVKQEVAALAGFAKSRKITIDLKLEDTPPVRGVRHALALMIRNILHNAVKFSPAGGTVTAVLATEANGKVRLSVSDTGAGIPDKHVPHVFERFYRVDKSQSGSGLGLSIVQWVAETHQANIELNRNDIGGLNFSVVFGSGR
jgi:signal transduction histidine kinase